MVDNVWEIVMQCRDNSERIELRIARHQFAEAASYAYYEKSRLKSREPKILSVRKVD